MVQPQVLVELVVRGEVVVLLVEAMVEMEVQQMLFMVLGRMVVMVVLTGTLDIVLGLEDMVVEVDLVIGVVAAAEAAAAVVVVDQITANTAIVDLLEAMAVVPMMAKMAVQEHPLEMLGLAILAIRESLVLQILPRMANQPQLV